VDAPQIVVKKETEEEKLQKQEAEIEELQKELSHLQQETSKFEQETQSLIAQIRQFESRLGDEDTRRQTLEKEYKIKKKVAVLTENADENIAELEGMSKEASKKLQELAVKWEEHRVPLVEQLRALKDAQLNKEDETKASLEQIKTMRAQMKAWVAEIHQKDDHYKQLQEALDALPKDMTRAVYTRNILEIVKNVKKQKLDIDKILIDTRNLQKEINTVSDTLGRVFAVVDELVFADANNKDTTAIQAYKHIAGIDKNFKKLVSLIEDTGQARNNVLNLDAKIEQIQLRTNSLNTERLEKDLAEVKEENQALQTKLKKQGLA
jgi:chromosome segregation ATPase